MGNTIVIDYTQNEVSHEVTKIVKGQKRRAICAFIHKNNFMDNNKKVLVSQKKLKLCHMVKLKK